MISDVMTIVPLSLATAHLQAGHVVGRRVPGVPKYHLGAAFRREADLEPNIRHFLDCLSTAAREMERSNAERMKSFN
jgi:DNA-binding transcriptional LysR family regulator